MIRLIPKVTLPRNATELGTVTRITEADHDALWCLATSWDGILDFMQNPKKYLAKSMKITGESKYSVLFTYTLAKLSSKMDCLLQGVVTKPLATVTCKPLHWEKVIDRMGIKGSIVTAEKVVTAMENCLGAFDNSVQITFRPDMKVAYSHIMANPDHPYIATAFALMALNPARVLERLLAREKMVRKYRESRALRYIDGAQGDWIEDSSNRVRFAKVSSADLSFIWEGPPSPGCYFCAQCVGSYKQIKQARGEPVFEISNNMAIIAEYCPPEPGPIDPIPFKIE